DRQVAEDELGNGKRDHGRRHEERGRHEERTPKRAKLREDLDQPGPAQVGEEEDKERTQFQRELQHRMRTIRGTGGDIAFAGGHSSVLIFENLKRICPCRASVAYLWPWLHEDARPAMACANSSASNGSRSSTPSPTPMK